jgi:hypothetical protein
MKSILKCLSLTAFLFLTTLPATTQTYAAKPAPAYAYSEDLDALIDQIVTSTQRLEPYVTLEENMRYLRPIKVLAGKTIAMIHGRGSHSERSIAMCELLVRKIRSADVFIEERYSVDATFTLILELQSYAERLDKVID